MSEEMTVDEAVNVLYYDLARSTAEEAAGNWKNYTTEQKDTAGLCYMLLARELVHERENNEISEKICSQ